VESPSRPPEEQRRCGKRTLADVLYADKTTPVSEKDWVDLVRSIAAGDQQALQALYARTHRIVFTLTVRITGNRATAEELTVDVFHDVWRRAATYDPAGGSVVGWIMNQAQSRAIDRLRFDQRKKRVDRHPEAAVPTMPDAGPQNALDLDEQSRRLRDALAALPPHERQAIETAFFADLTYEQTAQYLKQPVGTIKTRIRSGLAKLRHTLAKPAKDV
jgi:RNA polymerase sigma-70 factor, ECF subfamily